MINQEAQPNFVRNDSTPSLDWNIFESYSPSPLRKASKKLNIKLDYTLGREPVDDSLQMPCNQIKCFDPTKPSPKFGPL